MSTNSSNRRGDSFAPSRHRGRALGAKAIGSFVPSVARAAFEANGFPSAAVLADWPTIVGRELAAFTAPERLIWPRRPSDRDQDDRTGRRHLRTSRMGATLVLRVDGPRALEIQHTASQLIERINGYFGYGAVAALRLIQAPVRRSAASQPDARPAEPPADTSDLEGVRDDRLRAALSRLRARVE